MKSLKLLAVPAVLLNAVIACHAQEVTTVRILFTNNSNGKLENCFCRNDSTGGLAERVGFIRKYREQHSEFLLLDSGGYLGLSDVEKKGPKVFELMKIMGYDAFGIGDQELYKGFRRFMELFGSQTGRLINASLVDSIGKPVFTPYRIFEIGDIRVGVIGIFSAETFRFFPDESRDFTFDNADAVLDRLIPEVKKSADYIVLLSQMGRAEDVKLAERRSDIDLIIGGHSQTLLDKAIDVSGCRIVQAGKGGGQVGEIILTFDVQKKRLLDFTYKLIEINESYPIPEDIKPRIKDIFSH